MDTSRLLDTDVNVSTVGRMTPSTTLAPSRPAQAPATAPTPLVSDAVVAHGTADPASCLAGSVAHSMGLVVAPSTGRFRPLVDGGRVDAGTVIAVVTGGGGRADEVRMPAAAVLNGLLAREGQLVQPGQAVAWFQLD